MDLFFDHLCSYVNLPKSDIDRWLQKKSYIITEMVVTCILSSQPQFSKKNIVNNICWQNRFPLSIA